MTILKSRFPGGYSAPAVEIKPPLDEVSHVGRLKNFTNTFRDNTRPDSSLIHQTKLKFDIYTKAFRVVFQESRAFRDTGELKLDYKTLIPKLA